MGWEGAQRSELNELQSSSFEVQTGSTTTCARLAAAELICLLHQTVDMSSQLKIKSSSVQNDTFDTPVAPITINDS